MAVTPTIQNVKPVVGASADVWGGILNDRVGETYTDINALAALANANETGLAGALLKTGGTMTGPLLINDVAPTASNSAGFRDIPVINFDADRTLAASDDAKMLRMNGSTARTVTIPTNASVPIQIGYVVVLRAFSAQAMTVTRQSGVSLRIAGQSVDKNCTVASYGYATLTKEDTNAWILSGAGAS